MRKFCLQCVYKHIASAAVADAEMGCGYPEFMIYVVGNLDHAAQEAAKVHPELADTIRAHRLALWDSPNYTVPYEALGAYVMICTACPFGNWPDIPPECAVTHDKKDEPPAASDNG